MTTNLQAKRYPVVTGLSTRKKLVTRGLEESVVSRSHISILGSLGPSATTTPVWRWSVTANSIRPGIRGAGPVLAHRMAAANPDPFALNLTNFSAYYPAPYVPTA